MRSVQPFFIAAMLSFLLWACSQTKPIGQSGTGSVAEEPASQSVFPHPEGWNNPSSHGTWVHSNGDTVCLQCHSINSNAPGVLTSESVPSTGSPPSCHACHPLFPHEDNWVQKERHGDYVLQNGEAICATRCHGSDMQGGIAKVSCNGCHSIFPHPADWEEKHGAKLLELGGQVCQGCHGNDFTRILGGRNCFSCHPDYPHGDPEVWSTFAGGHGERVQSTYRGNTESCQLCHGEDLQKRIQGSNCFSCHPAYPHSKKIDPSILWRSFEGHGQYVLQNSKMECQLCHGVDYTGGPRNNPSCRGCHDPYPHREGWRREEEGQPQGHGLYVEANGSDACATSHCHGTNLVPTPGTTQGPYCLSCHDGTYPHPSGWSSGTVHGVTARVAIDICKSCHGMGLDMAPAGHLSCKNCHPSYLQHESAQTGVEDWEEIYEGHGNYLMNPSAETLSLLAARGIDTTTLNGRLSECRLCHGSDYAGGISSRSCRSCHSPFPHDQAGWSDGPGHGQHLLTTLSNDATTCKTCHGSDLLGGISGVSCKQCHTDYPHDDPNWRTGATGRTGNTHATRFVTLMSSGNTTACQECHGANYDRTVGGKQCTGCHTHSAGIITHRPTDGVAWSAGGGHGAFYKSGCPPAGGGSIPNPALGCFAATGNRIYDTSDSTSDEYCRNRTPPSSVCYSSGYCKDCHGVFANFSQNQSRSDLTTQSDCYRCHFAYPHVAYTQPSGFYRWSYRTPPGHQVYIGDPLSLFTDSSGAHPSTSPSAPDPIALPAWQNSCGGGTAGSCHNGTRPGPRRSVGCYRACNYCHQTTVVCP